MVVQVIFKNGAFIFCRAQFHFGDQTAKILVSSAGRSKQGKPGLTTSMWGQPPSAVRSSEARHRCRVKKIGPAARGQPRAAVPTWRFLQSKNAVYFRPNMRLDPSFLGRHVKSWRTINTITVDERHGWHLQFGAACDQAFRQG